MTTVQQLPVAKIAPSPANPRIFRENDPELVSLAASIAAKGVLQPILVRPVQTVNGVTHQIIAGERRWRATKLAKLADIPAIVRTDLTDQEALELTVTENLQREDLHPLEEARGVAALLAIEGTDYRAVAKRLGKSLGWVARRARLTKLAPSWRKHSQDPKSAVSTWSAAHLELIARLEPDVQAAFLRQNEYLTRQPNLTLDDLQRRVADLTHELKLAPWALDDATLVPKAGACAGCPTRSSQHPGLFEGGDRCLNDQCWSDKLQRHLARRADELAAEHGSVILLRGPNGYGEEPRIVKDRNTNLMGEYEVEKAKAGDKGAKPSLVVAGDNVGHVRWVKLCQGFTTSRPPDTWRQQAAAAERKAKLERSVRRQIHEAVRAKVTALRREDLVFIALAVFEEIWSENRKRIVEMWGWKREQKGYGERWSAAASREIPKLTEAELARLLVDLAVIRDTTAAPYDKSKPDRLLAAAKRHGVDAARIRRTAAAAQAKKKAKPKPKAAKKPAAVKKRSAK
ncbi:MAG TPA: ParB/RepB/Spo0J family partition protein [Thermoanaerobaculia bacterium]|nr:ParB/RepB/Spo0J family partition protein [Thermoanaerobaculia bacterium]